MMKYVYYLYSVVTVKVQLAKQTSLSSKQLYDRLEELH